MSGSASLSKRYFGLLRSYVDRPGEAELAAAGDLGRELVEADVSPEEIGEAHDKAIRRLTEESPKTMAAEKAGRMASLSIELLKAYGLAFRERLEERERVERAHIKRTQLAQLGAQMWLTADMSEDPLLSGPTSRLTQGFVEYLDCAVWGALHMHRSECHADIFLCADLPDERLEPLIEEAVKAVNRELETPVEPARVAKRVHAPEVGMRACKPIRGRIMAPFMTRSRTTGLAFLFTDKRPSFSAEEEYLFSILANQLGVTLENHRLFTEMRELDRMRSEFIAVASHELRTPVHNVQGFIKLAMDPRVTDAGSQRDFLVTVDQQADRLARLVDNFTDVARLEAGRMTMKREPVAISELVAAAIAVSRESAAQRGVSFVADVPEMPAINGDRERILQVLSNLVNNALAFSPRGSNIQITVKVKRNEIVTSVSDSGIGVRKNALDKIFDRFYQADSSNTRSKEGSGLGLYICKQIVEAHGGRIWAESEFGHGSKFSFALPLRIEAAPGRPARRRGEAALARK